MSAPRPTAYVNARLVDPESGFDGRGALIVVDGVIAEVLKRSRVERASEDLEIVDLPRRGAGAGPGRHAGEDRRAGGPRPRRR